MINKQPVRDPRHFQIAALTGLLLVGLTLLDFSILPAVAGAIVTTALISQLLLANGRAGVYSALISALSLCLLLRTQSLELAALAAAIAIASKLVLKFRDQHMFNPTALALVVVTSIFDGAWISPGQWGHTAYLLIAIAGCGSLVSSRASRLDISLAFLAAFAGCCFIRAFYLGDPLAIPLHQLNNGALLIFAFFMISDPRTTPRSRGGRLIFATMVALVAASIEFIWFRPNGAIYALVFCAPLVPLINHCLPATPYTWPERQGLLNPLSLSGVRHG